MAGLHWHDCRWCDEQMLACTDDHTGGARPLGDEVCFHCSQGPGGSVLEHSPGPPYKLSASREVYDRWFRRD
jgi:hypothetical protein